MSAKYSLKLDRVINWLLPLSLRKPRVQAFAIQLSHVLGDLHRLFRDKSASWDEDLKYAPGYTIQVRQLLREQLGREDIEIKNHQRRILPFFAYTDLFPNNFKLRSDFDSIDYYQFALTETLGEGALEGQPTGFKNQNEEDQSIASPINSDGFVNLTVLIPSDIDNEANIEFINTIMKKYLRTGLTFDIKHLSI